MNIIKTALFLLGSITFLFGLSVSTGIFELSNLAFDQNTDSKASTTDADQTLQIEEKITSSSIDANCQLVVNSNKGNLSLPTNFDPNLAKCDQYSFAKLSESGQYVAFEDLSVDGVDALIKVFSYDLQKITLLHDLGEFSVLDLVFLPNDQLAALISLGFKGEQKVFIYNLDFLFSTYKEDAILGEFSKQAIEQATGELPIPKSSKRAASLRLKDQNMLVFDETGNEQIVSFSLDSI